MLKFDLGLMFLAIFAAWHYALRCGYISDDHAAVEWRTDIIPDAEKVNMANVKKEKYWVRVFNDGIVMFYITRIFWRLGLKNIPFAWHLFSLALHFVNAYLLVLIFTPLIGQEQAIIAAGFWAVNPMLNQGVVWISGRPYVISTFLALSAILLWSNPLFFLPLYGFAVITNLSITFLPFIILILHPAAWQAKIYIALMIFAGMPFIMWKFHKRFFKALIIDRDNFRFRPRKVFALIRVIGYYIWTFFVPVRMGWYHQAGFRYNNAWEKFNIWTLASLACVVFLAKQGLPGWWFILGILPNSNIFATNSFLQDRYVYFASFGIALILAPFFAQYPVLFYCAITFYITRAYMYSRHLINDEEMYRENWRNHPNSDYAINNLSYFLIQQQRFDEARVVILRGLAINKTNKMLWYNLGVSWAAQGHFTNDEGKFRFLRAVDCWKTTLQLEPRWERPANDLKKLVKLLVENKVLTLDKNEAAQPEKGMSITLPNIIGLVDEK